MKVQAVILSLGIGMLLYGAANADQSTKSADQARKLFARAKADDFMGDEGCVDCHGEKAKSFKQSPHAAFMSDPKLPNDKRGCEGCHGPGFIHQADENAEVIAFRKMDPKESAAACLRCHESTLSESHWKRSEHARSNLSCVSCHQIHPDSESGFEKGTVDKGKVGDTKKPLFVARIQPHNLLKADEATLCGSCHGAQVAEFRLANHHPIPEGRMQCSDCHNAHPSKKEKIGKSFEKDKCVKCHSEVAGPFVHEHDPVAGHTGSGCAECHKPHGSSNPKMLNSFSRGLCAQCHTEKLARHFPGQTCWSAGCHVAPHGSNTSPNLLRR
jgi:predicted CXXCH cytochrome family protein